MKRKNMNATFATKGALKTHVSSVHEKKSFGCNICEKTYPNNSRLKRHIAIVHEKKKSLICDICKKTFSEKSTLENHIKTVHEKTNHGSVTFVTTGASEIVT